MPENQLRLDPVLGATPGPVPADLAEGLATDGTPLVLQHDQIFASLPPPPSTPGPTFDWGQALASLHAALSDAVPLVQWFFLLYFMITYGSQILFNLVSLFSLIRYRREQRGLALVEGDARHEIPISLIVPVCDQASAAVAAVRAMLQLDYAEFEIIIVADGTDDETLQVLRCEFSLAPFPEAYRDRIQTRQVKSIYASTAHPNLRLLDKEKGGKADALNAGINCARYPLYCGVDVAFTLQRDSLRKMGRPFVDNPAIVAACSAVRIANGCEVRDGFVSRVALPHKLFVQFQIVDRLRAFLPGRAWRPDMNVLHVFSSAFTVFRKEAVVTAGGYRTDVADEEMGLLHRLSRQANKLCRISLVPDPVCWVFVPETMSALRGRQRAAPKNMGPLFELSGYAVMTSLWLFGVISFQAFWTFLLLAIGLSMLASVSGVVREELPLHYYPRLRSVLRLFAVALLENFGYRQLAAIWWPSGFVLEVKSRNLK